MFSWRSKKIINSFNFKKKCLSGGMVMYLVSSTSFSSDSVFEVGDIFIVANWDCSEKTDKLNGK